MATPPLVLLLGGLQGNLPTHQLCMGNHAVQGTFQLTDVRRDLVGKEFQDLDRYHGAQILRLGLQNSQTQLVRGGMNVSD